MNRPLSNLQKVKDTDSESDIEHDPIRVFLIHFRFEGVFWGNAELTGYHRNRVLLQSDISIC